MHLHEPRNEREAHASLSASINAAQRYPYPMRQRRPARRFPALLGTLATLAAFAALGAALAIALAGG